MKKKNDISRITSEQLNVLCVCLWMIIKYPNGYYIEL